jgi:hypothetical protein
MKRLAIILFLFCAFAARATFVFTNEFNATENWSSFDAGQFTAPSYLLGGAYFRTAVYLGNPQFTNHQDCVGASGSSWGNEITNHIESSESALWASYKVAGYNLFQANDNGGYQNSNTIWGLGTNYAISPGITFNGTAFTNEGITTVAITHWFVGNAIQDGGSAASNRNAGCIGLNTTYSNPQFDLFNEMRTNFTDDATNYYALGHPKPWLSLMMGMFQALNMGVDTNVWSVNFNFSNGTASTNNCTVTGLTMTATSLTCGFRPVREAMAWDVPDGIITNDARPLFGIIPALGTAFNDTIKATGLPANTYGIYCNGVLADVATDVQLASGRNWFTNYSTPFWTNRVECLGRDRDKCGANRVSLVLHSAGSTGSITGKADMVNFGSNSAQQYTTNAKRGTNYIAAMQTYVDQVRTNYDVAISSPRRCQP